MANPPHFLRSGSVAIADLPPAILASLRKRKGPGWEPPASPRMVARPARIPAPFPSRTPPGRRARVGLVTPVLHQAGAESWMVTLARSADPERVAWMGCAVLSDESYADPEMADRVARFMPLGYGTGAARALAAACDVLITWASGDVSAITGGLEAPPRVLGVAHSPAQWWGARELYARSGGVDRWAAVSESARDALPAGVRASATIIGNCVDGDRMRATRTVEETRRSWGVPPGSLVAGYYGRMSEEKRPEVMAEIAGALPAPWRVVVVGGEYDGGRTRKAAEDRRLANIAFPGPDPLAGDVLRAMDVLIVPSAFESWGLSIAEAIEVGTPVVSTPVGIAAEHPGLTRVVGHGASGAEWATEVEAAVFDGRPPGQLATIAGASRDWRPERFGREWTDVIVETAGVADAR